MGSSRMVGQQVLALVLMVAGQSAWTTPQRSISTPTTPVPILRYIDRQNTDGSYTYGFEGADGTYKVETRYEDGRVQGKYGYFDPEGVLREATYGAQAGRGFEPQIEGIELPEPTIVNEIQNEVSNFSHKPFQPLGFSNLKNTGLSEDSKVRIVNGRRAVLRKRLRPKASPAPAKFVDQLAQKKSNLLALEEQLRHLRQQQQQLIELQQRQSTARVFPQEAVRSCGVELFSHPFVQGLDLTSGSYSISYRK